MRGSLFPSFLAVSLVSIGAVGCAEDEEPDAYETPTPSPNQGEAFELNGTFARKTVLSQYVENVFNGEMEQQTLTTYSVVTLERQGDGTSALYSEVDCETVMTEISGSTTTLNQGFYDNSSSVDIPVTVTVAEVGGSMTMSEQVEVKGAVLDNPASDDLPKDPDDERVIDFDEDGNPGYTIYVEGMVDGTLWATERYVYSWTGSLVTADDISGLMTASLEDSLMYSSSILISTSTPVDPDPDPTHQYFEMHRAPSELTCSSLLDDLTTYFPE